LSPNDRFFDFEPPPFPVNPLSRRVEENVIMDKSDGFPHALALALGVAFALALSLFAAFAFGGLPLP
jgi:hypothetical protein